MTIKREREKREDFLMYELNKNKENIIRAMNFKHL